MGRNVDCRFCRNRRDPSERFHCYRYSVTNNDLPSKNRFFPESNVIIFSRVWAMSFYWFIIRSFEMSQVLWNGICKPVGHVSMVGKHGGWFGHEVSRIMCNSVAQELSCIPLSFFPLWNVLL
jgi:hypothetical protein